MEPMWPLEDLSDIPDDWLEAFLFYTDEDNTDEPGVRFAGRITAIYRMREIEEREGRNLHAFPKNARAEKLRREGRPVPVERDQLYKRDDVTFRVGRVSAKGGWAELHIGDNPGKRHRLPLPEDFWLTGWARLRISPRVPGDEGSLAVPRLDQPALPQHLHGAADRRVADAPVVGQVAFAGQLLSRREAAVADGGGYVIGDLLVQRHGSARPEFGSR